MRERLQDRFQDGSEGYTPRRRVLDVPHVALAPGQPIEGALRTLKRRLEQSGLFAELRRREAALSPGEARRQKSARARARERRRARRAGDGAA